MRRWIPLLLAVATTVGASQAAADVGDRSLALELAGGYPTLGTLRLSVRGGLSDWFAVQIELGAGASESGGQGEATLAGVFVFDVLSWVPELLIGVGGVLAPGGLQARLVGRLGARYYLNFDWSLALGIGGAWLPPQGWQLEGYAGVAWHL